VQAQPALTQPAKKSPMTPEQKATVTKILALSRQSNVCKSVIDLKVENATLEDVVNRVKTMLPGQAVTVEVRGANPVRVGFDLKGSKVGDVLDHVAALAGCKLFVLSGGLLIVPPSQLTEAERADVRQYQGGEWAKSTEAGGSSWSVRNQESDLFTHAIAQEATGSNASPLPAGVIKTTFGNFSPEAQTMLQELATWSAESVHLLNPSVAPLHLSVGSLISIDSSQPNSIFITFPHDTSNQGGPLLGVGNVTIDVRSSQ